MSRSIVLAGLALALAAAPATALARQHQHHRHHPAAKAGAAATGCDRACLTGMAGRYVQAMVAKAPGSLPWAEKVGFSEDGVPMMIGDALWGSISAARPPALVAADPTTGQVAWFGVVEEHGEPTFLALRLKVENGRISEAETQIRRKGGPAPYGDPAAFTPEPAFGQAPAQRSSRERLKAQAGAYFEGLQRRGRAALAPACVRRDNGAIAPGGCAAPAAPSPLTRVRDLAAPVIDEARGVVVATGLMDFSGREAPEGALKYPESRPFMAAFRIAGGRIERIEMIYTPAPYLMPSPWR